MGKKKKENNKVLWRVAPLSGLMLFWHVGWVEPLSLSLSLSLSLFPLQLRLSVSPLPLQSVWPLSA